MARLPAKHHQASGIVAPDDPITVSRKMQLLPTTCAANAAFQQSLATSLGVLLHDFLLLKALSRANAPTVLQEAAEEVEEEVEKVAKQASKPFKSFFGGGGRAKASEIETEVRPTT